MKNLVISFIFIFHALISQGQMIPNSEFDNWTSHGSYDDPDGWKTPNQFIAQVNEAVVFKSSDAYSGNFSAKLETRNLLGFADAPGLLTLADIYVDILSLDYNISGGLPLNENVQKLTGMYKYEGVDNDSATVLIYNFKRDNQGNIDTIGLGFGYLHDASEWTPFTVEMGYLNSHVPDTFNVIILSSGPEFHPGSILYVDSIAIETNTGIIQLDKERININIYPNPTTDYVYFSTDNKEDNRTLTIFDIKGKMISSHKFQSKEIKISTSKLPTGIYTYRISNTTTFLNSGKFTKK